MQFTPTLELACGQLKPLSQDDAQTLLELYQRLELPAHQRPQKPADIDRLIELSVQMAATQRGMLWVLQIQQQPQGILNLFDWQPSLLKASVRLDAQVDVNAEVLVESLNVSTHYLAQKYHIHNFCYPLLAQQKAQMAPILAVSGFHYSLTQRQAQVLGDQQYADIELYHKLLD